MSIKQYYICIFTVLLFPLSCARLEENPEEAVPSADYFEAVIAAPTEEDTKTVLQEDSQYASRRAVYWQSNDQVLVGGALYTVTGGAGSPKARLSGGGAQLQDGKYKAYYPAGMVVDSVTGELEMPAVLTHPSPVDGKVVASNLPMYAESDGKDNKLSFRHLFGVFSFQITGTEKVRRIELTSTTHNLSGPFRITKLNTNYTKNLDIIEMTGTSEENKKIVLDFGPSGVQLSADELTEFLIPVPPTYSYRDDSNYYKTGGGFGSITIKIYGDSPQPIREIENPSVGNPSAGKIVTLYKNKFLTVKLDNWTATSPRSYGTSKKYEVYAYNLSQVGTPTNHEKHLVNASFVGAELDFTVNTNMGFTVTVSDPDGAVIGMTDIEGDVSVSPREYAGKINVSDNLFFPTSNYTPKPFTINDAGDRVYFAPGNLLYKPSTRQWRLAERQFDTVGTEGDNAYIYSDCTVGTIYDGRRLMRNLITPKTDSSDWTDIFAWGTSGYTGWASGTYGYCTDPCSYVTSAASYFGDPRTAATPPFGPQQDPQQSLTGDFAMGDWGVANRAAINAYHGFPDSYDWRTPMRNEFTYVLNSRPYPRFIFVRLDAGKWNRSFMITFTAKEDPSYKIHFNLYQQVPVLDGLLIFPDGFADDYPELSTSKRFIDNWPDYESAGCVFLPVTTEFYQGSSSGASLSAPDSRSSSYGDYISSSSIGGGRYWTSSATHRISWETYGPGYEWREYWSFLPVGQIQWDPQYNSYAIGSGGYEEGWRWERLPVRLVRSAPSATGNVNPGGIDSGGQDVEDIDVNDTENYNYGW